MNLAKIATIELRKVIILAGMTLVDKHEFKRTNFAPKSIICCQVLPHREAKNAVNNTI